MQIVFFIIAKLITMLSTQTTILMGNLTNITEINIAARKVAISISLIDG